MFFRRFICWVRYIFTYRRMFSRHFWKFERKLTTENDAEELEEMQIKENKYTTLQILTPHWAKIYRCRVCGVRRAESGWNDMVAIIPPGRNPFQGSAE